MVVTDALRSALDDFRTKSMNVPGIQYWVDASVELPPRHYSVGLVPVVINASSIYSNLCDAVMTCRLPDLLGRLMP
jgi:hypothetical protein